MDEFLFIYHPSTFVLCGSLMANNVITYVGKAI